MKRLSVFALLSVLVACTNNPYPSKDRAKNYTYNTFPEPPKHLDPAISYSEDEYVFLEEIYEPVLTYHFLKRPYELIPLTATEFPKVDYFDKSGSHLPDDAPSAQVARAVYTIHIQPGIRYQNHPAFAKDAAGNPRYFNLTNKDVEGIEDADNFPEKGTRELEAADYVWQIKRLAHPVLDCPILSILVQYIDGLDKLAATLSAEVDRIRAERKQAAGALYNQERDELENPIFLDLDKFDLPGVEVVDRYTFRIILKTKYPQMRFWLAMPFFAPVPKEVDRFYAQGPLVQRRITMDTSPVGTGAYRIERYAPNEEIVLARNENYRKDFYPTEGEPSDVAAGYLQDAGKPVPYIDKAIYKYESEALPRWSKFVQGYFDSSAIASSIFGQALSVTPQGPSLSEEMKSRDIKLEKDAEPTVYYYAFNMLDPVVGGYTPDKKKLRQAIAIAIDNEEYIAIFRNGRDQLAMTPIPPGIFGYQDEKDSYNPWIYDWDEKANKPVRKSIDVAKRLLAEAGYPGGRTPDGNPLVLYYDNSQAGAESKAYLDWMRKQLAKIDVDLESRTTDYNRFQDKINKGNFQLMDFGWHADYPDPENFMFLLYGPNSRAKFRGENAANYDNPEFNRLFLRMATMGNTSERMDVIRRMLRIVAEDMPWSPNFYLVTLTLHHDWYGNTKPMAATSPRLKYRKVDAERRELQRENWNKPVYWPITVLLPAGVAIVLPAWISIRRRQRRSALS